MPVAVPHIGTTPRRSASRFSPASNVSRPAPSLFAWESMRKSLYREYVAPSRVAHWTQGVPARTNLGCWNCLARVLTFFWTKSGGFFPSIIIAKSSAIVSISPGP